MPWQDICENFKTKQRRAATADELMIFPNTHEAIVDQASIAQCEENECHFKIGFSAGLLVQQEAVEQMKEMGTTG